MTPSVFLCYTSIIMYQFVKMNKKLKILFPFILYSMSLFGQIEYGELTMLMIDSFTYEYDHDNSNIHRASLNLPPITDWEDTTLQSLDGQMAVRVVNESNYKECYERSRGILHFTFSPDSVFTSVLNSSVIHLFDFKNKTQSNYVKGNSKYVKSAEFKLFEGFKKGEIIEFKENKADTILINGIKGYKIEFKEKFEYETKTVKMYVTEAIEFPIKLLVDFPEDIKLCPIYIEVYDELKPKNKIIRKLISVNSLSREAIHTIIDTSENRTEIPKVSQVFIEINKKGDLKFQNEPVNPKELNEKLKNYDWKDRRVVTIVAETGTKFTYVTKVMGLCNKYKIRVVMATE
jgi:biopolymer transport protein ExbD